MTRMNLISAVAIAAFSIATSDALSTVAPPKAVPRPSLFAPIQRADLKSKLMRAAKAKDEEAVLGIVAQLASVNPTDVPTRGLMGYGGAKTGPLDGRWKLLYTNARDAEAPARTEKQKDSPFGEEVKSGVDVTTGQRIDAKSGKCTNFIKLEGEKRPFDQLEITIQMTPLSDTRVRLDFQNGRALNANAPLPFLQDFKFSFPPPAVGDVLARIRGKNPSVEPPAYFDVLYIDNEVRVHRTGEGKIFVQQRGN